MQTAVELPETLYDQARRAAGLKGISVEEFIAGLLREKLHVEPGMSSQKQRVPLPLVLSAHPGTRPLTADRVAEILSDDDVSC